MMHNKPRSIAKPKLNWVSGGSVAFLLNEAVKAGGNIQSLLREAHLPYTASDLLNGRIPQIPRSHLALLMRDCTQVFEAHASLSSGHPPMVREEYQLLCYCLISCETLGDAILRAARFCQMLEGKAGELSLEYQGSITTFKMNTIRGDAGVSALISDLLGLSSYHRLFSWLIGNHIDIQDLRLRSSELVPAEWILELFHYPVHFSAQENQFQFPSHYLNKPIVRTHRELTELLQFFPFDLVSSDLSIGNLHDTVSALVKASLIKKDAIPTIAQLASLFNVSKATLRRRLDEEGTSISRAKDECRSAWAKELLCTTDLNIDEIADKLCFSTPATFRRAFKQWTGCSPNEFRVRHLQGYAEQAVGQSKSGFGISTN